MEDIFKKLKTDFEFVTGWIYKGLAQALGAGYASRLKEFDDKLGFIEKNAFIATADKDYLYLHSGNMLPPKPAEIAQGLVVFYGINGSAIIADTELKDDNGTFRTISDVTITETTLNGTVTVVDGIAITTIANQLTSTTALVNGVSKQITIVDGETIQFEAGTLVTGNAVEIKVNNALATVIAGEAGIAGNRILNDVLKLKITIAGVNTELGALQVSGGIDDEDVEVYRQRVMFFMSNPQAPFSEPNIIAINIERIQTLKYVWVKGGEYKNGKVTVIAMNCDDGLTQYEIEEIFKNTSAIKPANTIAEEIIAIGKPQIKYTSITIKDLLPISDGLKNEVIKNIEFLFDSDMFEKEIAKSEIEAIVYKTKNGAEEVKSFVLISGWQEAQENVFYRLDNVVFQ